MTQVVVLSAHSGALDPALPEVLRNAWGGGTVTWLEPDTAAEFPIEALPDTFIPARADLDGQGVDLNVVSAENRRKRVLLADMDSTMIQQECIDELADAAGVGARVKDITARAMNGDLDFDGALTERVALLAGLPEGIIDEVLRSRITLMPGGDVLVRTMKGWGAHAALVSGGFTAFTARVGEMLGFDENRANTLLIENGVLTGQVGRPILGRDAKVAALHEITERFGLTAADVLAVGDGANDLGMLTLAGFGVAAHAKPSVQAQCSLRVNHGDLRSLLYLQGVSVQEFRGEEGRVSLAGSKP